MKLPVAGGVVAPLTVEKAQQLVARSVLQFVETGPTTMLVTTGCTKMGRELELAPPELAVIWAVPERVADGVVGDAAAGVAIPGAGAEATGGGDDIDQADILRADGPDVAGDGNRGAVAVDGGGGRRGAEFTSVERDAVDGGGQGDGLDLADERAGVAAAEGDGGFLSAACDGDTERNGEEEKGEQGDEPTH